MGAPIRGRKFQISIGFFPEEIEEITKIAKDNEMSRGELVRYIMLRWLDGNLVDKED